MTEDNKDSKTTPVSDEQLKAFAAASDTATVMPVPTGRFIVPIPNFDDEVGNLLLPNAKELKLVIPSGNASLTLTDAVYEGAPQHIPADGNHMVVINNISPTQAIALQAVYDHMAQETGGVISRPQLVKFFETATGLSYNAETDTISMVSDNIGIHGDVYHMDKETFKARHNPYGTETSLTETADNDLKAGHYQKLRAPAQAIVIEGGFTRTLNDGTELNYPEPALALIGADGKVSSVHRNDISVSYEKPNGEPLIPHPGAKIDLPTYDVNEVANFQKQPATRIDSKDVEKTPTRVHSNVTQLG